MPERQASIQRGFLVLADISGYTSFLSQTELDHSQEILSELLETILRNFRPVLTIHKIEGDAIFAYSTGAGLARGEALLELIEATYAGFRDRLKNVRRHTTCTCRACQSAPMLDLKFLVHYGEFAVQQVGAAQELAGSDVNLVHRLLKNHVTESTGWRGYAAFTQQALSQMAIRPNNASRQVETYDYLGEVAIECIDLRPRYDEMMQARRVLISPQVADVVVERDFRAPPSRLWEWFNDPARRSEWQSAEIVPVLRVGGRLAPGARNHCVHGQSRVIVEDLLDIKPYDYFTVEQRPRGTPFSVRETVRFVPNARGGTHLVFTCRSAARGFPRWAGRLVSRYVVLRALRRNWLFDRLEALAEAAG